LSDCQNTAYLGLFLNGAQYGLLFDLKIGNRRPEWTRIREDLYHTLHTRNGEEGIYFLPLPAKKTNKDFPAFPKKPSTVVEISQKSLLILPDFLKIVR